MKKIFFLLTFLSVSLVSIAQQDSIKVVIECDSLYRPFLEHAGQMRLEAGKDDETKYFNLNDKSTFYLPVPNKENERFELMIIIQDIGGNYCEPKIISYSRNDYRDAKYNPTNGNLILTNSTDFKDTRIIQIEYPPNSKQNKYLIDNTCPTCHMNDSISWIEYGLIAEDPETGLINLPEVFNPYNNPILDEIYNPGCSSRPEHWYCHRCKREY